MPQTKYLNITIDDQPVDIGSLEEIPVAISYKLEERDDFQKKSSSNALSITFPATPKNDKISNTFHNPAIDDMTAGQVYKSARRGLIESGGYELLIGKAFLKTASHTNTPLKYEYDFYGNNADWMIDLQEATLFDFLQHISLVFSKDNIIASWAYDGTDENLPYVFAPIRYAEAMGDFNNFLVSVSPPITKDYSMMPEYMKPSLSPYWIIYWAFKSLGYRISSTFLDTAYFRRLTMPWTWGNFLFSDGTAQEALKFLAKSVASSYHFHDNYDDFVDMDVSNDFYDGGFDNSNSYTYNSGTKEMRWTYPSTVAFGNINATFQLQVYLDAILKGSAEADAQVYWYKNGVEDVSKRQNIMNMIIGIGTQHFTNIVTIFQSFDVSPTDYISVKVKLYLHRFNFLSSSRCDISILGFDFEYARILLGSTINFTTFTGFKKYKFLDLLRGIVDTFNLELQTDPISKIVYIEPEHPYSLVHDQSSKTGGYFNNHFIDWEDKQDISKESVLENFSDNEREMILKFKDDSSDGMLKTIQDRNVNTLGIGKFVFPSRFKTGKLEIENRFFSPVMHYTVTQWNGLEASEVQMICMIPENVSNTSRSESENTFQPKLTWYKGLTAGMGWVFDNERKDTFPFMFAVNYLPGGENDPILSYSDEKIGTDISPVVGKGLLRKFYLQRMAIMRNGQHYTTNFHLKNYDVSNFLHREHIICRGQRWELVEINNYLPLKEQSTSCFLRRWVPITVNDNQNIYPAGTTVLDPTTNAGTFDVKYSKLKCLPSDIPK